MAKSIGKNDGRDLPIEAVSLRDLRSFIAVARAGGVTQAARDLGYSQATLSAHLAALENALGIPLIEPRRRGAFLTDAGRMVLARAELLLHEAATLQRDARSAAGHPTIRLAACEPVATYRLPPILAAFSRRHPGVDVELRVAGYVAGRALVESAEFDLAIAPKSARATPSATLSFKLLYEEPMLALLPKRHRLASAESVDLADLNGETLLVGSDVCTYRALIVGALQESDVDVALRARFGDGATLVHGVAAGLGVAVLPAGFFLAGSLTAGIVALPLRPRIAIGIGLIEHRRRNRDSESLRALRRVICDGLQNGSLTKPFAASRHRAAAAHRTPDLAVKKEARHH